MAKQNLISLSKKRKPALRAIPENLLVGTLAADTLNQCKALTKYLSFAAAADAGADDESEFGHVIVLDMLYDALAYLGCQIEGERKESEAQEAANV